MCQRNAQQSQAALSTGAKELVGADKISAKVPINSATSF
jgi:hypothetical protein